MTKLWDKGYELDPRIERFAGSDAIVYDQRLVVADALGSIGHAAGLVKAGLLPAETYHALREELASIVALAEAGDFTLTAADEDVHTRIEAWLTDTLGEAGKQIHTARSRNDQV
ncbi:MAG: lyase family protein, partial [Vicinamibacterales bacterium]